MSFALTAVFLLTASSSIHAANKPPQKGEMFPVVNLPIPVLLRRAIWGFQGKDLSKYPRSRPRWSSLRFLACTALTVRRMHLGSTNSTPLLKMIPTSKRK